MTVRVGRVPRIVQPYGCGPVYLALPRDGTMQSIAVASSEECEVIGARFAALCMSKRREGIDYVIEAPGLVKGGVADHEWHEMKASMTPISPMTIRGRWCRRPSKSLPLLIAIWLWCEPQPSDALLRCSPQKLVEEKKS